MHVMCTGVSGGLEMVLGKTEYEWEWAVDDCRTLGHESVMGGCGRTIEPSSLLNICHNGGYCLQDVW